MRVSTLGSPPQTWGGFRLTTSEGLSGAEAVAKLGMPASNIYVAKSSVIALLKAEIRNLDPSAT